MQKGDITSQALDWLKDIRKTVSGNPRVYLDNTISIIKQEDALVSLSNNELQSLLSKDGKINNV